MGRVRNGGRGKRGNNGGNASRSFVTLYGVRAPKSWLLTSTALKIGLFAGVAGFVAAPNTALANCAATSSENFVCDGNPAATSFSFTPGAVWTGTLLGTGTPAANTGTLTITNNGDHSGVLTVEEGASIAATAGPGLLLTNTNPVDSTVTVNLNGNVTAVGTSGTPDGVRLQGATVVANIGSEENTDVTVSGTDDGFRILEATVSATINNYGTIHGLGGIAGDAAFGIEVNTGATGGWNPSKGWNGIAGAVTITNYGEVIAETEQTSGNGAKENAAGIMAGAKGKVTIHNKDGATVVSDGRGIYVRATQGDGTVTDGGDVEINNEGHIQGLSGSGATVITLGAITGYNRSYESWIGATHGYEASGSSFDFDNGNGLMVGLGGDGFNIRNISGLIGDSGFAVSIKNGGWWTDESNNGGGGVTLGADNGIRVEDTALGGVVVLNQGGWTGEASFSGGIIAGLADGIGVNNIGGSLLVNNDYTGADISSISLGQLDPELLEFSSGFSHLGDRTTGIWGGDDGIRAWAVAEQVGVSNRSGVIVGVAGDGIVAGNVDGAETSNIDEIYPELAGLKLAFALDNGSADPASPGGMVWGGETGVRLYDLDGAAVIRNSDGTIFGGETGIRAYDVWGGNVLIDNGLGGVVQGLRGDAIRVGDVEASGAGGGVVDIRNAGTIFGGDHAIYVSSSDKVSIVNSGVLIGDGSSSQAVIRLRGNDTATVTNDLGGVIASRALAGVATTWSSLTAAELPGWSSPDRDQLVATTDSLVGFVFSGKALGTPLDAYEGAARDLAISARDGDTTEVTNNSWLVGRIDLRSGDGSSVENNGLWLVTGSNQVRGTASGDTITNRGVIQSALDSTGSDWTSFRADSFTNAGTISMADGGTGDRTTIRGDYTGGGSLAIDVDLALAKADQLRLRDGDVTGATGVIVRLVEDGGSYGSRIEFANTDDATAEGIFYLDAASDRYAQMGGKGVIQDGLLAWYVEQDGHDGYDLVAGWGAAAYDAPGVITGAQNTFYSGLQVVRDHLSGGQYTAPGGGGSSGFDDAATKTAVWLKGSGDLVTRNTSVAVAPLGTVDTGSSQGIYNLLGGIDVIPGDSNFRVGVFGGYVASQVNFALPGTSAEFSGGTVGAYAAYNDGAFSTNLTVKGDLLGTTYHFAGTSVDATTVNFGAEGDISYRLGSDAGYFEPVVSASAMSTRVTDVASIDFVDANSLRAGAGAIVGTEITSGDLTTDLSLLAKVWNEFSGPNTAVITNGGSTLTATDDVGGVFGELSATAAVQSAGNDLSGFVSAGTKFSATATSYGVQGGLRVRF